MQAAMFFDESLLAKYDGNGPRYTSYPTALEFRDNGVDLDMQRASRLSPNRDLSLYIHIPFCNSPCYYCGCNKIVTRHNDKADVYLDFLLREIDQRSQVFSNYRVRQLHLGGGTPNFLTPLQMARLISALRNRFVFADICEMGLEVDPRLLQTDDLAWLANQGFNRLSIGVQDVDPNVQQAINRVQDSDHIARLMDKAREHGFTSINLDFIYGLPHQSAETIDKTLDFIRQTNPDRISLFSYAHLPQRFAAQRKIKSDWLPDAPGKLALMKQATLALCDMGYDVIGMDHFARPDDELAIAQRKGKLHRNFQGYTTLGHCDLLGLGVSSISSVGDLLCQNTKSLQDYYHAIENWHEASERGVVLSCDDLIRRYVISQLMCQMRVDKHQVSQIFEIDFDQYFADACRDLQPFVDDGLVSVTQQAVTIAPKGRLLVRAICMQFDAYARPFAQPRASRII